MIRKRRNHNEIPIVYENTVCAMSAFSVLLASFCFDFPITLQAVESYFVGFCIIKS